MQFVAGAIVDRRRSQAKKVLDPQHHQALHVGLEHRQRDDHVGLGCMVGESDGLHVGLRRDEDMVGAVFGVHRPHRAWLVLGTEAVIEVGDVIAQVAEVLVAEAGHVNEWVAGRLPDGDAVGAGLQAHFGHGGDNGRLGRVSGVRLAQAGEVGLDENAVAGRDDGAHADAIRGQGDSGAAHGCQVIIVVGAGDDGDHRTVRCGFGACPEWPQGGRPAGQQKPYAQQSVFQELTARDAHVFPPDI